MERNFLWAAAEVRIGESGSQESPGHDIFGYDCLVLLRDWSDR
jgi:hypothetical protein